MEEEGETDRKQSLGGTGMGREKDQSNKLQPSLQNMMKKVANNKQNA